MNFLAHFQLAHYRADQLDHHLGAQLSGAFLADFIRGPLSALHPIAGDIDYGSPYWQTIEAIHVHRRIDSLTDQHPHTKMAKRLYPTHLRRYAPLLVDVFYDYILASRFSDYQLKPIHYPQDSHQLERFAQTVYKTLLKTIDTTDMHLLWNNNALFALDRMSSQDWLTNYAKLSGIQKTLRGLSKRLSRPVQLSESMNYFVQHEMQHERHFRALWQQLTTDILNLSYPHRPKRN